MSNNATAVVRNKDLVCLNTPAALSSKLFYKPKVAYDRSVPGTARSTYSHQAGSERSSTSRDKFSNLLSTPTISMSLTRQLQSAKPKLNSRSEKILLQKFNNEFIDVLKKVHESDKVPASIGLDMYFEALTKLGCIKCQHK